MQNNVIKLETYLECYLECSKVEILTETYTSFLNAQCVQNFIVPNRTFLHVKYILIFTQLYILYHYAKYTTSRAVVNISQYGTVCETLQ
jgi:hypothetical protein